ncbi:hypothetical protein E1293_09685 [Actinomadura darangshiensis]|uniref:Uncharacterized protein n=1 Tax=Actinomadura darangshiensis TaxID=705336 RepID=A0A4R5BKV4_9ACTN|nr:hypothetical protein [Actinomadura darangshiensis]TDD86339.1 hypothetical protein E1293_09685 [Actinomadura darangshiensis]
MDHPPLRLAPRARLWRSFAGVAVVGALFYTSSYGSNDDFPLGPMTQFAFAVKDDGGAISSYWLEADTAAGTHVELSRDAAGTGMKRAEIEGQMDRIVRDPSMLQGVADGQRRLHPGGPRLTRIYVVQEIKKLRHGKVVSTLKQNRVVWNVR